MCLWLLGLEKLEHFNLSFHLINYFIHEFNFFCNLYPLYGNLSALFYFII